MNVASWKRVIEVTAVGRCGMNDIKLQLQNFGTSKLIWPVHLMNFNPFIRRIIAFMWKKLGNWMIFDLIVRNSLHFEFFFLWNFYWFDVGLLVKVSDGISECFNSFPHIFNGVQCVMCKLFGVRITNKLSHYPIPLPPPFSDIIN